MQHTSAQDDGAAIIGIDIASYLVRDPRAAITFYRDVLGMTPTEIDQQGRGAEFTLADGSTFGVWKPDGVDNPSGATVMFAVGDANAAVARIRERGTKVSDPFETPVCFIAHGQDPEGNAFVIHQRKVRD